MSFSMRYAMDVKMDVWRRWSGHLFPHPLDKLVQMMIQLQLLIFLISLKWWPHSKINNVFCVQSKLTNPWLCMTISTLIIDPITFIVHKHESILKSFRIQHILHILSPPQWILCHYETRQQLILFRTLFRFRFDLEFLFSLNDASEIAQRGATWTAVILELSLLDFPGERLGMFHPSCVECFYWVSTGWWPRKRPVSAIFFRSTKWTKE